MERAYDSLSVAIDALRREGYTEDFNLCEAGIENKHKKTLHEADELNVVNYYRFEGMTNPDDSSVLYVIETDSGEKGVLVDAYGAYSGNVPQEMIKKLHLK
ncbi:phosphoribosylpyrophosphate synthetase [Robertkochia solimangrovi]|uniref:phosphoribosylpyrophosphate synthetase n=1 Tax=Robertkochia solimangrovi TaxID=2213046 RepID=UPI00117C74D9|nr:phosphoribosylpyrophosphate synthetase [Robertkochia solimangrovi]TRZ42748.1 phosphoribosylpyrophosphate synthetase [Robertkochia solimangrovi]